MAKILDIGLAVVIWATSDLAWLLGICQSPAVRQMNQQKSRQYRRYPSNTSLSPPPTSVTGAGHLVPDDLDSRLDGRHLQSLDHDHDCHDNCQLESGADTESRAWAANREEGTQDTCTQHRAVEHSQHSRVPGHWQLASANMMRTGRTLLLIIQVKESKSNLKILNSQRAFGVGNNAKTSSTFDGS